MNIEKGQQTRMNEGLLYLLELSGKTIQALEGQVQSLRAQLDEAIETQAQSLLDEEAAKDRN